MGCLFQYLVDHALSVRRTGLLLSAWAVRIGWFLRLLTHSGSFLYMTHGDDAASAEGEPRG